MNETRYFEFNDFEYYALIAVTPKENEDAMQKAMEIYVDKVADIGAGDGKPDVISQKEAKADFMKSFKALGEVFFKDFREIMSGKYPNGVILMDANLM